MMCRPFCFKGIMRSFKGTMTRKNVILCLTIVATLGMAIHTEAKPKMTNYLFAYFTGNDPQEDLYVKLKKVWTCL